jgi:hypothetical protein
MTRSFAVALSILAFGCSDPGREARQLGEKHPVSAEVKQLVEATKKLAKDGGAREALEREHGTWVVNRAAHCLALSKLQGTAKDDSKKAAEEITSCFVGVDRQRAEAMRTSKLVALLEQPPITPVKELTVRMSIPFERGQSPGDLRISPDGGLAVVGKTLGDIDIYDTRTAQLLRVIRTDSYTYLNNLQFSPNGRVLFVSSRQHRGLKIYDPYTGDLLREYDGVMGPYVLLPGARYVLHADKMKLHVYDAHTNKASETPSERGYVSHLALSPDGKRAAVMSTDRQIALWDIVSGETGVTLSKRAQTEFEIQQLSHSMGKLEFTRSGDALLGITHEGTLTRWSLPDLKRVQVTPIGRISAPELLRLPDTNRVVVPGFASDGQVSHVLFWDLDKDVAATVPLSRHGNGLQVAWTQFAPFLYVASVAGISVVDLPDEKSYRRSPDVLEPLLDARQQERIASVARMPMLRGVADDAAVEAVGVYQGRPAPPVAGAGGSLTYGPAAGPRKPRPVNVIVGSTERPVILVLSSSEPVEWLITQSADARVKHILMSGAHDSVIVNRRPIEITKIGDAVAYELRSSGYAALENLVRQYLGKGIDRFQGTYAGTEFYVGTRADSGRPRVGGGMYRCADGAGNRSFVDRPCSELGLQDRGIVAPPPPRPGQQPTPPSIQPGLPAGMTVPGYAIQGGPGGTVAVGPGPRPHERIIRCGGDTIVCDANDTVICGGKRIPCR